MPQLRFLVVRGGHALRRTAEGKVVREESAAWVAVCLDHFILGSGDDLTGALAALLMGIRAELKYAAEEKREPFAHLGAAPTEYQVMWPTARPAALPFGPPLERLAAPSGPALLMPPIPVTAELRVSP